MLSIHIQSLGEHWTLVDGTKGTACVEKHSNSQMSRTNFILANQLSNSCLYCPRHQPQNRPYRSRKKYVSQTLMFIISIMQMGVSLYREKRGTSDRISSRQIYKPIEQHTSCIKQPMYFNSIPAHTFNPLRVYTPCMITSIL